MVAGELDPTGVHVRKPDFSERDAPAVISRHEWLITEKGVKAICPDRLDAWKCPCRCGSDSRPAQSHIDIMIIEYRLVPAITTRLWTISNESGRRIMHEQMGTIAEVCE